MNKKLPYEEYCLKHVKISIDDKWQPLEKFHNIHPDKEIETVLRSEYALYLKHFGVEE